MSEFTTAEMCLSAFEEAKDHFSRYYQRYEPTFNQSNREHGAEVEKRLKQLIWFLGKTEQLVLETEELDKPVRALGRLLQENKITHTEWAEGLKTAETRAAHERKRKIFIELEILTESFYWFSNRTRSVLRVLPGFETFESTEIRNVRNHLLEHPESKSSGVLINSFGMGEPHGPVLKAIRYDYQADLWTDKGLFKNALEFGENISKHAKQLNSKIATN